MRFCCIALLFGCLVAQLFAQVTGVISGTVTDPSKAPLPNAKISITNADRGAVAWTGQTNDGGVFRAPDLPAGRYDIAIEANGFKHQTLSGIPLAVDQRADIPISMEIGQVSETMNVEASVEGQLATGTASLGSIITPSQVQDLPMVSRNVLDLLNLTPGISTGSPIASSLNSAQLSINGSRTLNSEFLIDGVSVVTGSTGAPQTLPPVDSIREMKVLTSSYSAEYGRTSGAIVTMITNAGVNQFHGAAYGYFRNEDLNANNFFNNLLGKPRSEDRFNLFGGKLGGPITIPKVYHGRSKAFFFVNYEGLIQASPYLNTSTVPSGAYATGDFSTSPTIIDFPGTHTPIQGNKIPGNMIDPAAQKILSLVPASNSPGTLNKTDNIFTNNFVSVGSSHPTTNTGVVRLDHSITESIRIFGTFVHFNNFSPTQPVFPATVLDSAVGDSATTGYESTLGYTQAFSPTLFLELRFGFFRNNSEILPPSAGINVPQTLDIGTQYGIAAPEVSISGFSMLGSNTNTQRTQIDNNYQTLGSLTKAWGNHLMQFGGLLRKNQFDDLNPTGEVNGTYNFTGEITSPKNTGGDAVQALADFLMGEIKTGSYSLPQPLIGRRNYNLGLYFQDDWKIRRNLTLNLGLRWEYEAPMTTANNEYSRVDPTTGQVLFAGKNASADLNLKSAKLNFGPRAGVAYSVTPKTVIRSGFGVFYSQLFSILGGQVLFPGYTVVQSFQNLGTGVAQPFSLHQGLPSVVTNHVSNPQANIAQFNSPSNPLTLTAYDGYTQASPVPYAEEWNFGIERQLMRGTLFDVNYVGSHGVHLAVNLPTNTVPYNPALDTALAQANTTATTQLARPYPTIGSFNSLNMEGTSTYQALQISVRRQYSNNVTFIVNYTRSKALDDASGLFSFSQPSGLNLGQFPQQFLGLNKGPSEFDRPNVFTAAILYRTKGNKWVRNFEIYPILTVRSGLPLYIGQSNDNPAQTGTNQQRPNVIDSSVSLYVPESSNGTGVQYLLPTTAANFPLAPVGPFFVGSGSSRTLALPAGIGTLGRDVIRGPGEFDLALSLGRQFDLTERLKLKIRMEAFNATNHTNFQQPAGSLALTTNAAGQVTFNSPNFGLITAANPARILQLVARFDF